MSNHTPGPWKARGAIVYWADVSPHTSGKNVIDIAIVQGPPGPELNANAALIAKAPQMHTLLRQAVDQFLTDVQEDETVDARDAIKWLFDFVKRAHEVIDG